MEKSASSRLITIKMLLWFIVIIEALIFFLAVIFGHYCGYRNSFIAHGILGAVIGLCLLFTLFILVMIDNGVSIVKKIVSVFNLARKNNE